MVFSRIWYLVLAAAGAAAIAAALLGQAAFNRQYDRELNDQLRRDRFEIELMLRTDARTRIDAIGPLSAHQDVRSALRAASGRRERSTIDAEVRTRLGERLRALNGQLEGMAADILFAIDNEGYIVAQLGGEPAPAGASLGAFPLVERVLAGYMRDDVWVYNDKVYRMASRPVIDGGQYVGAIVHGKLLDNELARRLSERLNGPTVTFFMQDTVIGGHMPSEEGTARAEDVAAPLAQALEDEGLANGGRTDPIDLAQGTSRAVYSLVTGTAAYSKVGYAIARPRKILVGPFSIFDQVADEDVAALPWPFIAGGGVLAFLFAMLFLWLERDRPFGKLKRATDALAKRELQRFDLAAHGGGYRRVAEGVNQALDLAVEAAGAQGGKRKPANLDEILGPTPDGGQAPAFFGFAAQEGGGDAPESMPPVPPAGQQAAAGMGAPPAAVQAFRPPSPGGPPAGPPAFKPPPGGPRPMGAPSPAMGPPLGMGAPAKPDFAKGTLTGVGAGESDGGGPMQAPSHLALGNSLADDDEIATAIAPIPQELLNATGSNVNEEEAHFREVYEKFVETKKTCGESTAGLTYQKFSQTLKKNRDQIVDKHGAAKVRFTVYVKAGKAALKATPVK